MDFIIDGPGYIAFLGCIFCVLTYFIAKLILWNEELDEHIDEYVGAHEGTMYILAKRED